MKDALKHLKTFKDKKILVVGDVMLDEYIEGEATRISPEAPIPVLLQKNVRHVLGGAGNVAANVATLGGKVTLLGVVGTDDHAKTLQRIAKHHRIQARFLSDGTRPTTTKLRFVSGHHQLVRIDIEDARDLAGEMEAKLIKSINATPKHDLVIVSDYRKGTITKAVATALQKKFGAKNIIADMKPSNALFFKGVRAITPNVKEASEMTGISIHDDKSAQAACKILRERLRTAVVLTRGESGVSVAELKNDCVHLPADVRSVRDVTGAGDTMIAAIALMLASGVDLYEAARFGNLAAGIVVGVSGTYALTPKEIESRAQM